MNYKENFSNNLLKEIIINNEEIDINESKPFIIEDLLLNWCQQLSNSDYSCLEKIENYFKNLEIIDYYLISNINLAENIVQCIIKLEYNSTFLINCLNILCYIINKIVKSYESLISTIFLEKILFLIKNRNDLIISSLISLKNFLGINPNNLSIIYAQIGLYDCFIELIETQDEKKNFLISYFFKYGLYSLNNMMLEYCLKIFLIILNNNFEDSILKCLKSISKLLNLKKNAKILIKIGFFQYIIDLLESNNELIYNFSLNNIINIFELDSKKSILLLINEKLINIILNKLENDQYNQQYYYYFIINKLIMVDEKFLTYFTNNEILTIFLNNCINNSFQVRNASISFLSHLITCKRSSKIWNFLFNNNLLKIMIEFLEIVDDENLLSLIITFEHITTLYKNDSALYLIENGILEILENLINNENNNNYLACKSLYEKILLLNNK